MSEHTPTQELVLEVLIARARLGETLWTFRTRPAIVAALNALAREGTVNTMSGIIEGTIRASLTEQGKRDHMARPYEAPLITRAREEAMQQVMEMPIGAFIQRAAGAPRIGY